MLDRLDVKQQNVKLITLIYHLENVLLRLHVKLNTKLMVKNAYVLIITKPMAMIAYLVKQIPKLNANVMQDMVEMIVQLS